MKIGFHLPISSGFLEVYKEAQRLSCESIQIFVKNPRSWKKKVWRKTEIEDFKILKERFPIFAHISYLPNPAKALEERRNLEAVEEEIKLCLRIGIPFLVIHPGSNKEKKKGILQVAEALNLLLQRYDIKILLENTAGAGFEIGGRLEELLEIAHLVGKKDNLLFCLDTAHLFQAGYDIRKREIWEEVKNMVGKERIGLIHLNDSKTPFGSRFDRHFHIGKGYIGLQTFSFILKDKDLEHLSFIMETPEMGVMDEENMKTVRSLLSSLELHSFS